MTSLPPAASLACSSADSAISRSTGRQRSVLRPRVGLLKPGVELELVVAFVGEAATTLEVGLQIALQPLDDALGLRTGRLAEPPSDLQLASSGPHSPATTSHAEPPSSANWNGDHAQWLDSSTLMLRPTSPPQVKSRDVV